MEPDYKPTKWSAYTTPEGEVRLRFYVNNSDDYTYELTMPPRLAYRLADLLYNKASEATEWLAWKDRDS